MINFKEISFSIGGVQLFENTSAFVPTGHKVGIVGRNGTGKTSLFKLVLNELKMFIKVTKNGPKFYLKSTYNRPIIDLKLT